MMKWDSALQVYIDHPEKYGKDTFVYFDEDAVIIHDSFPKARFHLLVLPRSNTLTKKHPTIGLNSSVKNQLENYVQRAIDYIYEGFTQHYQPSDKVQSIFADKDTFIKNFLAVGIHSVPSMKNLHIHVITKDFNSPRLKHKKHYNSFNTNFFVNWIDLPLKSIPNVKETELKYIKGSPLICSYCGQDYGSQFKKLKDHLTEEFNKHFTEIIEL